MNDESVLGLLLRAHKEVSAQIHGETYISHNISAANCFENAERSIAEAIRQVGFAGQYVARQGDRKESK